MNHSSWKYYKLNHHDSDNTPYISSDEYVYGIVEQIEPDRIFIKGLLLVILDYTKITNPMYVNEIIYKAEMEMNEFNAGGYTLSNTSATKINKEDLPKPYNSFVNKNIWLLYVNEMMAGKSIDIKEALK